MLYGAEWRAPGVIGVDAPLGLTRNGEIDAEWRDPNLLFGQTCGYPYRKALQETCHTHRSARICFSRL